MERHLQALVVLGVTACCDSPLAPLPSVTYPVVAPPSDTTTTWAPPARITLSTSPSDFDLAGLQRGYWIEAFDARGRQTSPAGVQLVSSDPSVAEIDNVSLTSWNGTQVAYALVKELVVGSTTISATLGSLSASTVLQVEPFPTTPVTMAVDSFMVLEYDHHPLCATGCPDYYLYAPVMTLREPDGTSGEVVRLILVDTPTLAPVWCGLNRRLASGEAARFNDPVDPYPWSNDYIVASLTGPVTDSIAVTRVIVENERGELGTVEARGPILRGVAPNFGTPTGSCLG